MMEELSKQVKSIRNLGLELLNTDGAIIKNNGFSPIYPKFTTSKREDILKKYAMLNILGLAGVIVTQKKRREDVRLAVLAECDCGNKIVTALHDIKGLKIRSCGCYRSETSKALGERNKGRIKKHDEYIAPTPKLKEYQKSRGTLVFNCIGKPDVSTKVSKEKMDSIKYKSYRSYHASAIKRDLNFDMSLEQFSETTCKDCYICGLNPKGHNGIDRIDSKKGYEESNIQPCCSTCNYMKSNHSIEFFKERIKLIYENLFLNNN